MLLWFIAWYLVGVVGCVAGLILDWYNGNDVTVKDLGLMTLFSIAGPIMILAAFGHYFETRGHRALIKGRN